MWSFLCFWGRCIIQGWQVGHSVFVYIQFFAALIFGALAWRKTHKEDRKHWEEPVKKWSVGIFVGSFLFAALFVAPVLQYHDLERQNRELKGKLAKQSNPLKQRAAVLGNQLVDFVDQARVEGKSDEDIKKDYGLRFDNQVKATAAMMDAAGLHSDTFNMTTWWSPDPSSIRKCGEAMRTLASTLPDSEQ
jgi:hypothetical protein